MPTVRQAVGSNGERPHTTAGARTAAAPELWLEAVYRHARERGDQPWLIQPGSSTTQIRTWAQGVDEALRIAAHLTSLRLPPGSAVAILGQNSPHFVLMDLAIWMAGHVSVPLYATMPAAAIRYALEHCEARAIFVGKLPSMPEGALPEGIPGLRCELSPPLPFVAWQDVVASTRPLAGNPVREPDALAVIMYTSGTTGRPKGVEHTFRAMASAAQAIVTACAMRAEDRLFSYLPLAHTAERLGVSGVSYSIGAPITFNQSLDTLGSDLQLGKPTVIAGVPRVWMKLRDRVLAKIPYARLKRILATPIVGRMVRRKVLTQLGFDELRVAGVGAAPCPAELIDFWRAFGIEMRELYGMTENFGYSHLTPAGVSLSGRIGPALPGAEARIADDGEIQMRSPGLMRGYHRDPEATAAAFTADGFLRTGDRGDIDAQGNLRVTGRTKEIFKTSKGKYVSPSEVESALLAADLLDQACVMGHGEPQPSAVATLAESARVRLHTERATVMRELDALLQRTNAARPSHEQLSRLALTSDAWTPESGLLTPTLKLKRAVLEERYAAKLAAAPDGVSWLDATPS